MNPSPDFLNAANIARFRDREPLAGYFPHYDERCVEWPWALARIPADTKRLLDAGATLNHRPVLEFLPKSCKPFIHTLAPKVNCYAEEGISYVYGDLRELPYRDGYFDVVTCISVLEHVGMDNTIYGGPFEHSTVGYLVAVAELWRVLATGGSLIITVPFGAYEDAGWFQQFNHPMLMSLCSVLNTYWSAEERTFYWHAEDGWRCTGTHGTLGARYNHVAKRAESIACLKIVKGRA